MSKVWKWVGRIARAVAVVNIAIGLVLGAFFKEYERGTFGIVVGVTALYLWDWRPESKVEVQIRAVIDGMGKRQ